MAAPKLFTNVDSWFNERGYIRKGTRNPHWIKELGPDLEFVLSSDPIKISKDMYETRVLFWARFPKLDALDSALHLKNTKMGTPTGIAKSIGLMVASLQGAWSDGYQPLEASGTGPNWDAFLSQLDSALPEIEAELTIDPDFRHNVETSKYWKVSQNHRFAEMFILLHFKEWDKAQHMLDTTDWRKVINPQNIADMPNKPTTDEDVRNVTEQLANYINTHRNNS